MPKPIRRIAIAHEYDGPGGAEMMILQLAEELRRRAYEVIPILPERKFGWLGDEFVSRGFSEPRTFKIRKAVDPVGLFQIIRELRESGADLLHSHEFSLAVYGAAAASFLGVPHVITMHGNERVLDVWRRREALRWSFARSRAVIAVSTDTKDHMVGRIGIPDDSVVAIPNGISFAPGDRSKVRAELGLPDDALLVLAIGNVIPRKGHQYLIEALGRIRTVRPDLRCHVAIAGGGQADGGVTLRLLGEVAAGHGVTERVHLLGHRQDTADLLAACDVFAMPSLWEGLPVAMLEAMFCERPVVASNVSGIPQAVTHGMEGLLVPPQDSEALAEALLPLLTDRKLRAELGGAAARRAKADYSVATMVDAYERCYYQGA